MKTERNQRPFAGEFESEVCLPVRVRYQVTGDGEVEVLHIAFTPDVPGIGLGAFRWPCLPLRERLTLDAEAATEAQRIREESPSEPE